MPMPRATLENLPQRFWAKVERGDGCWLWMGVRQNLGYGIVRRTYLKPDGAHRVSWELANGPIPEGMSVLHHCDNPPCVRPDHLFLGTFTDNMADKIRKGRGSNSHRGKTHCKWGHPFDEANTYRTARQRHCRACFRIRQAGYRDARKQAAA